MAASLASAVRADVSLAYVDAARLLKDAPQVESIKQLIREEFKAREQRLAAMNKQITLLKGRLSANAQKMSAGERTRLQNDINNRKLKYQHARDELDRDKQLRFSEEEQRLTRIIHEVIQQVAQDEKLDLVLQAGVLWVSPRIDITEKVLARLREIQAKGN